MNNVDNIIVHAPAKINLFLHVVGKRADGHHLLESLTIFTEYGDEIQAIEGDDLSIEIVGKFSSNLLFAPLEENLVWKAAIAVQNYLSKPRGAKIILTKNLPIASGIGGGSADASATIKALCALWELDIHEKKLSEIALSLGSDVPACLYGKPVFMSGVGENLKPVELRGVAYLVLINPNIPLATAEVFREFSRSSMPLRSANAVNPNYFDLSEITDEKGYGNDLESVSIKKIPVIADIINLLKTTEGCYLARMSGSGATCFGLYQNKKSADYAAKKLQEIYPQAWCISTCIM